MFFPSFVLKHYRLRIPLRRELIIKISGPFIQIHEVNTTFPKPQETFVFNHSRKEAKSKQKTSMFRTERSNVRNDVVHQLDRVRKSPSHVHYKDHCISAIKRINCQIAHTTNTHSHALCTRDNGETEMEQLHGPWNYVITDALIRRWQTSEERKCSTSTHNVY